MIGGRAVDATWLAKLPLEDREWLYGQLSAAERARLVTLLSRDAETDSEPPSRDQQRATGSTEETVARANPWQITQALVDEPEWMLALLLSRRSWPWSEAYLEGLDDTRRQRVWSSLSPVRLSVREATYRAAVAALAEQLGRASTDGTEPEAADGGVGRLMKLCDQWMRDGDSAGSRR